MELLLILVFYKNCSLLKSPSNPRSEGLIFIVGQVTLSPLIIKIMQITRQLIINRPGK